MKKLKLIPSHIQCAFSGCMRFGYVVLCAILIVTVSSCGYRLQGSGSVLPNDVKSISIKPVQNSTTFSGLGPKMTEKIRSRFERYGVVKIVDADEPADADLVANIVSLTTTNRDVQGQSNVQVEQNITITLSAELRKKNGQILFKNNAITANESFGTVSSNVVTSSSSFATGNLGAAALSSLSDREIARGQAAETVETLMDEAARKLYMSAIASDF